MEICNRTTDCHLCTCKHTRMGQVCDCDVNYYADKPNGNEFCREHGQRVPTMGSNEFKCACADGVESPQPVFSDESPKPKSDGSEIDEEKVTKKEKGGSNTPFIVIVCLAVPVVLGGAGYMYIQQQNPKRTGKNAAKTVPLMQVSSSSGKPGDKPHHGHHPATKGSASSLKTVTSSMGSVCFSKVSLALLIILASSLRSVQSEGGAYDDMPWDLDKPIKLPAMNNSTIKELAHGYPEGKGPYDYLMPITDYVSPGGEMQSTKPWSVGFKDTRTFCERHKDTYQTCVWFYAHMLKNAADEDSKKFGGHSRLTWDIASLVFMVIMCGEAHTKPTWIGCPTGCYDDPCRKIVHAVAGTCHTEDQVKTPFVLSFSELL